MSDLHQTIMDLVSEYGIIHVDEVFRLLSENEYNDVFITIVDLVNEGYVKWVTDSTTDFLKMQLIVEKKSTIEDTVVNLLRSNNCKVLMDDLFDALTCEGYEYNDLFMVLMDLEIEGHILRKQEHDQEFYMITPMPFEEIMGKYVYPKRRYKGPIISTDAEAEVEGKRPVSAIGMIKKISRKATSHKEVKKTAEEICRVLEEKPNLPGYKVKGMGYKLTQQIYGKYVGKYAHQGIFGDDISDSRKELKALCEDVKDNISSNQDLQDRIVKAVRNSVQDLQDMLKDSPKKADILNKCKEAALSVYGLPWVKHFQPVIFNADTNKTTIITKANQSCDEILEDVILEDEEKKNTNYQRLKEYRERSELTLVTTTLTDAINSLPKLKDEKPFTREKKYSKLVRNSVAFVYGLNRKNFSVEAADYILFAPDPIPEDHNKDAAAVKIEQVKEKLELIMEAIQSYQDLIKYRNENEDVLSNVVITPNFVSSYRLKLGNMRQNDMQFSRSGLPTNASNPERIIKKILDKSKTLIVKKRNLSRINKAISSKQDYIGRMWGIQKLNEKDKRANEKELAVIKIIYNEGGIESAKIARRKSELEIRKLRKRASKLNNQINNDIAELRKTYQQLGQVILPPNTDIFAEIESFFKDIHDNKIKHQYAGIRNILSLVVQNRPSKYHRIKSQVRKYYSRRHNNLNQFAAHLRELITLNNHPDNTLGALKPIPKSEDPRKFIANTADVHRQMVNDLINISYKVLQDQFKIGAIASGLNLEEEILRLLYRGSPQNQYARSVRDISNIKQDYQSFEEKYSFKESDPIHSRIRAAARGRMMTILSSQMERQLLLAAIFIVLKQYARSNEEEEKVIAKKFLFQKSIPSHTNFKKAIKDEYRKIIKHLNPRASDPKGAMIENVLKQARNLCFSIITRGTSKGEIFSFSSIPSNSIKFLTLLGDTPSRQRSRLISEYQLIQANIINSKTFTRVKPFLKKALNLTRVSENDFTTYIEKLYETLSTQWQTFLSKPDAPDAPGPQLHFLEDLKPQFRSNTIVFDTDDDSVSSAAFYQYHVKYDPHDKPAINPISLKVVETKDRHYGRVIKKEFNKKWESLYEKKTGNQAVVDDDHTSDYYKWLGKTSDKYWKDLFEDTEEKNAVFRGEITKGFQKWLKSKPDPNKMPVYLPVYNKIAEYSSARFDPIPITRFSNNNTYNINKQASGPNTVVKAFVPGKQQLITRSKKKIYFNIPFTSGAVLRNPLPPDNGKHMGIDLGMRTLAVTSTADLVTDDDGSQHVEVRNQHFINESPDPYLSSPSVSEIFGSIELVPSNQTEDKRLKKSFMDLIQFSQLKHENDGTKTQFSDLVRAMGLNNFIDGPSSNILDEVDSSVQLSGIPTDYVTELRKEMDGRHSRLGNFYRYVNGYSGSSDETNAIKRLVELASLPITDKTSQSRAMKAEMIVNMIFYRLVAEYLVRHNVRSNNRRSRKSKRARRLLQTLKKRVTCNFKSLQRKSRMSTIMAQKFLAKSLKDRKSSDINRQKIANVYGNIHKFSQNKVDKRARFMGYSTAVRIKQIADAHESTTEAFERMPWSAMRGFGHAIVSGRYEQIADVHGRRVSKVSAHNTSQNHPDDELNFEKNPRKIIKGYFAPPTDANGMMHHKQKMVFVPDKGGNMAAEIIQTPNGITYNPVGHRDGGASAIIAARSFTS